MKKVMMIGLGFAMGAATMLFAAKAFSAGSDFGSVDVSAYQGQVVFFNKASGDLHVYNVETGKQTYGWKVAELGKDLTKTKKDGVTPWDPIGMVYTPK